MDGYVIVLETEDGERERLPLVYESICEAIRAQSVFVQLLDVENPYYLSIWMEPAE